MEQSPSPTREELHRQKFAALHEFFTQAEQNGTMLTSKMIQEQIFPRHLSTVRRYISRHWSWFLKPVYTHRRQLFYRCENIKNYPKDYFIQAHWANQMQYFFHFATSIDVYEKSKEAERQKRREAQTLITQQILMEPEIVEEPADQQQAPPVLDIRITTEEAEPGELNEGSGIVSSDTDEQKDQSSTDFPIADNEAEEMEGSKSPDIVTHAAMAVTSRESASFMATTPVAGEPSPEDTLINVAPIVPSWVERLLDMLGFSGKSHEALDQLRQAVERLIQERNRLYSEVTRELQTVKQALDTQSQQTSLSLAELSQFHTNFISQVQAFQQGLAKEQEQLREEFTHKIEMLTEEIRQSRTPPDFSPIHIDLTNQLGHVEQTLTEVIKQSHVIPELPQIATEVTNLQQQVHDLALLMSKFAQRSSISSNGHTILLQESIQVASVQAQNAINTLANEYLAWLEGLERQLQMTQRGHDETGKYLQTIKAYVAPGGEKSQDNSADGEEPQDDPGVPS